MFVFARQALLELKAMTLPTCLMGSIINLRQNFIIPHEPLCGMKGSDVCGQAFAQVIDKPTASPTGLCLPWFVFPAKRLSEENDMYLVGSTQHLALGSGDGTVVEQQACDQKVSGSSPGRSSGLFGYPFHPCFTTVACKTKRSQNRAVVTIPKHVGLISRGGS